MILALQLKQRGKAEGIIEGKIEGERESMLKVATRLLKKGLTPAYVQEVTDLDEDTIKELNANLI